MPETRRGGWLAVALLGVAAAATAAGEDLAPFLSARQKAGAFADKNQWQDVAKTYGAFAAAQPQDACAPLASALQGLILLRDLKQTEPAREAFLRAAKAPDTPFGREVRQVAFTWLARLQMQQIDVALRRYWVDRVEYPERLEQLAERKLAPPELLADPWGKPFKYSPRALRAAPGLPRQIYTLECTAIAGDSRQLPRRLKESAEFPKKFQLKGIGGVRPLSALIAVDKADKPVHVAEGEKIGSATLIKLTREGGILVDGGFVAVLAK